MTAKCTKCKKHWNLSWMQLIPKSGYKCPVCSREKEKDERIRKIRKSIEKYITS